LVHTYPEIKGRGGKKKKKKQKVERAMSAARAGPIYVYFVCR
jgi:hypothetical protein